MKLFLNIALVLVFATAFGACDVFTPAVDASGSAVQTAASVTGDKYELALGETVHLADGGTLTFDKVLSDNRCPIDVTCILAGRARARFTMIPAGGALVSKVYRAVATIRGGGPDEVPIETAVSTPIGEFSLRLVSLNPYPGEADYGSPATAKVYLQLLPSYGTAG